MAFYVSNSLALWGDDFNPKLKTQRELEEMVEKALKAYNKAFKPPTGQLGGIAAVMVVACAVCAYCCMGPAATPVVSSMAAAEGASAVGAAEIAAAGAAGVPAAAATAAPAVAVTGASSGLGATAAAIGSGALKNVMMGAVDRELSKRGAPKRDPNTEAAISELSDRYAQKFAAHAKAQDSGKGVWVMAGIGALGAAFVAFM